MTAFRALLIVLWAIIAGYTAIVTANHGFRRQPAQQRADVRHNSSRLDNNWYFCPLLIVTHVERREEVGTARDRGGEDYKILWVGLSGETLLQRERRLGNNIDGRGKDLPKR